MVRRNLRNSKTSNCFSLSNVMFCVLHVMWNCSACLFCMFKIQQCQRIWFNRRHVANVLNVLVLSHLGRRVPRGAATTPKPGVQHELNKSGVRWQDPHATKWFVLIPIYTFLTSIKRTPLVHQKGRIAWIWMVRRCKVQIDERDYFSGVTMCQNWFHSVCMYWAQTFVSKDMRSEVLRIAIVEYESIGVPVIMEDLIKCTVQWIRICGL